jgi:abortive infection bacteriophage resistance protein
MALKPALSIADQIELLRQRGMIVADEKKAGIFLRSNHYYRLNIYFHKFVDSPDHYKNGVRFSHIMAVYEYDRWLRNRILSVLEPIEINIRTRV